MRVVMKFGGAVLGNAKEMERATDAIIEGTKEGHQVIAVISALGGTTDSLIEIMHDIVSAKKAKVEKMIDSLASRHIDVLKAIGDDALAKETEREITKIIEDFRNVALGISHVGELTPRSRDFLLSFGERLSTPILAAAVQDRGVRAKPLRGGEAGIITDESYGEALPLINVTNMQLKQNLEPLLSEGIVPVVSGFIASTQNGVTTTLGRGGSDLTAALIGLALGVDELWFWKDVPGILTADPALYGGARLMETVAFDEAIEMAHFGARVIHPRALEVGLDSDLIYRIKNIGEPGSKGTLIVKKKKVPEQGVMISAIGVIDRVYLINISGARLVGTPRVVAKVLNLLADDEIDVLMISQSSSEANISIAVPEADADDAMNTLELSLLGSNIVREITGERDYCIVAVVGRGMQGTPGVSAKVFKSMADRNINIRTIAQGSSELNISFMVRREDAKVAVEALHKDFKLDHASG